MDFSITRVAAALYAGPKQKSTGGWFISMLVLEKKKKVVR